ncbi:hypothetical protein KKB83_02530 [Patescibacteria group bacterium]|nr:hypothetical protein [Patescibacteria group bacterium]
MATKQRNQKNKDVGGIKIRPKTGDILKLMGLFGAILISPAIPVLPEILAKLMNQQTREPKPEWLKTMEEEQKRWCGKFNMAELRRNLKRMYNQKYVELVEENGYAVLKLTKNGRRKFIKYRLKDMVEEMSLDKTKKWDGKWRLIIYDIPKSKRSARDSLRFIFKNLKLLQLQRSVYLCPYPCEDEIEFLRQYYDVGKEVMLLTVEKIENDRAYRKYFNV